MPFVTLTTNLPSEKLNKEFSEKFSEKLAETLGKPLEVSLINYNILSEMAITVKQSVL